MLDLVIELHKPLDRLRPGSAESTNRALDFIEGLEAMEHVLGPGCGTGAQTMTRRAHSPAPSRASICSISLTCSTPMRRSGVGATACAGCPPMDVSGRCRPKASILSGCEGAIDGVGFAKMLEYWNAFLKPGGYVAVTCPSWLTDARIAEGRRFLTQAGSGLDTVAENIGFLQKAGCRADGRVRAAEGMLDRELTFRPASYGRGRPCGEVSRRRNRRGIHRRQPPRRELFGRQRRLRRLRTSQGF